MSKLEFRLAEAMQSYKGGADAARERLLRAGLSQRGIEALLANPHKPNWGLRATTIETVCRALGVDLTYILRLTGPPRDVADLVRSNGSAVAVSIAKVPVVLDNRDRRERKSRRQFDPLPVYAFVEVLRDAVGVWDVRAFSELVAMYGGGGVRILTPPSTALLGIEEMKVVAKRFVPEKPRPILFAIGSPLVSTLADFALCRLSEQSKRLPFKFLWQYRGAPYTGRPAYSDPVGPGEQQGIVWNGIPLEVPPMEGVFKGGSDYKFDDAAIIGVVPEALVIENASKESYWILLMGFTGAATLAAVQFLGSDAFSRAFAKYFRGTLEEPLFVPLRVTCQKIEADTYECVLGKRWIP